jgi:hypothetical protein
MPTAIRLVVEETIGQKRPAHTADALQSDQLMVHAVRMDVIK